MKIARVCAALAFLGAACHPASGQDFLSPMRAVVQVTASSELASGNRDSYGVENIRDDTDRSWAEGVAGNGEGEWVRFDFADPTPVAGFVLRNGYGNLDFYARNNRVKSFKVVFDGGYAETVAVKDSWEFEQYRFAETVTCKSLRFVIGEVYAGDQYDDTCIAELNPVSRPVSDAEAKALIDVRAGGTLRRPAQMGEYLNIWDYRPFSYRDAAKLPGNAAPRLQLTENLPRIDGATALYPLYAAFVQAVYPSAGNTSQLYNPYNRIDSGSAVLVLCGRTEQAYKNLIEGAVDVIFCYEPSREEIESARQKGLRFKLTPVGRDAFVFFVNKNNPLAGLTQQQIRDIYAGRTRNWKGITGRDEPVVAYQRPENSGSQTVLQSIMSGEKIMPPMMEGFAPEMGGMIAGVAQYYNYTGAIGYSFLFYVTKMFDSDGIKTLAIDGVAPARETIANGSYPFVKTAYAVTIEGRESENTKKFIEWITGEQGQYLVDKTGYVPILPVQSF
jgi:phosphate transport system substrate-binding protein